MRRFTIVLSAASLLLPAAMVVPTAAADARHYYRHYNRHYYHGCRHSSGTTGLVAGGIGGALVGNSLLGHGALGTIAGGVGGAFAGRAIDRTITARRRCR
ncbi:hypothetical protein [uncultured Sphingomonas sp.]|uniref:hypothetical protein n=1 Tax=uncultured Sphingomonas sp. TaxID=158754 RepID=UPI0035CA6DF9